jgi:hypothetical protein
LKLNIDAPFTCGCLSLRYTGIIHIHELHTCLQTTTQNGGRDRSNVCDVRDDNMTSPSDLGKNEDSIDGRRMLHHILMFQLTTKKKIMHWKMSMSRVREMLSIITTTIWSKTQADRNTTVNILYQIKVEY